MPNFFSLNVCQLTQCCRFLSRSSVKRRLHELQIYKSHVENYVPKSATRPDRCHEIWPMSSIHVGLAIRLSEAASGKPYKLGWRMYVGHCLQWPIPWRSSAVHNCEIAVKFIVSLHRHNYVRTASTLLNLSSIYNGWAFTCSTMAEIRIVINI
jgi:hypothetical protein